jgi:peptidoglycan hydrolase-like protein with peptidoglycan-binding domain
MGGLQIDAQVSRREYSTVEASFTKTDLRMVRRLGELMKRTSASLAVALALGLLSPVASAQAQAPPAAPSADDAAMAAQKAAFLALPEATRKAAQDALVWLGFYNGVTDGDFGKRTRDAILAFQGSAKAPADGALSAPQLQALLAAAQKARDATGFQVVSDPKSGARLGAPLKLLSARGGARPDFASSGDADLAALYARCQRPHRPAKSPTRRSSPTPSLSSRDRTER